MSTPLPYRGRLNRESLNAASARSSPLAKSPTTPYDVYRLQHRQQRQPSTLDQSTASPNTSSGSVFVEQSNSPHSFASYRRNAGFGSPGASAARSTPRQSLSNTPSSLALQKRAPAHVSADRETPQRTRSSRYVRKKPWKQRLQELPAIWYDQLMFSDYLDFNNPALGYPLGILLHVLSLMVQAMHPQGSLRIHRGGKGARTRATSLFAEQGGLASRRRNQQDSAWQWSANVLMFFIVVAAASNAYHLLASRRRYHLWLKPTEEALQSENAKLVDLPNDLGASHTKPKIELVLDQVKLGLHSAMNVVIWLAKRALYRIRLIRYVGSIVRFFFPPSSGRVAGARRPSASGPQMHALDVWQAPDVPLRIFTLYSPLHALLYLYNIRSPSPGTSSGAHFYSLVVSALLMASISAQTAVLIYLYTGLVKDKALISGEVLNEYNQKVSEKMMCHLT